MSDSHPTHRIPASSQRLHDPNLAFLASLAAIALDSLVKGQSSSLAPVQDLARVLKERIANVQSTSSTRHDAMRFADAMSMDILWRAVHKSSKVEADSIEAIIAQAQPLVDKLAVDLNTLPKEDLIHLRDFALRLSIVARTTSGIGPEWLGFLRSR